MSTQDFIIQLFCRVDDAMREVPKHSQASLYPSEIVTLGLLCAIRGVGNRAFYRWIKRDYLPLFPRLPERTRLFRLFGAHAQWADRFLADPTVLGVADTYGIELLHPMRAGRTPNQIGKKGQSNRRWIVGAKLGVVLNKWGLVCEWDCNTANVHDSSFHPMIAQLEEQMVVLTDQGFHSKLTDQGFHSKLTDQGFHSKLTDQGFHSKRGDPSNMKVCERGTWNVRMLVERVFSMLHSVCHLKHLPHRVWLYLQARLAFCLAAFNILAQWHGLEPDEHGVVHLSIAQFAL